MEVTLGQLIQIAPELASTLRDDIRSGYLPAARKKGVAGRPYLVTTEDLLASDREDYQELAHKAENWSYRNDGKTPSFSRTKTPTGATQTAAVDVSWAPVLKIMESQHTMLQGLVEAITQELHDRHERIDRQQRDIQELSYKLGLAHQQLTRMERRPEDVIARGAEQA